jgi:hypothetical protein
MRTCVLLLSLLVATSAFRVLLSKVGTLGLTEARNFNPETTRIASVAVVKGRARALGLRLAATEESGDKSEESIPAPSQEADKAIEEKKELRVLGFNLMDFNDWITIFLSGVIAVQTFGIVKDIIVGLTNK